LQALEDAAEGDPIPAKDLEPWAELAGVALPDFGSAGPVVTESATQRQEDGLRLLPDFTPIAGVLLQGAS